MRDFIVVGGGIGGCAAAAMLTKKGYSTLLLEKESNLGGCASTFTHRGFRYNAGATTFAPYEERLPLYDFFKKIDISPRTKPLKYSHIVIQNNKRIKRFLDLESFVFELNSCHYHRKNFEFYTLIKSICDNFYKQQSYRYSKKTTAAKLSSMLSFAPFAAKFLPYLLQNAKSFIERFFGAPLEPEYQRFIDAQTLIAVQADTSKINFLTAALALGYPFYKSHYVFGGMGEIFEQMRGVMGEVRTKEAVASIREIRGGYEVNTQKGSFATKNIVLNTPIFDSSKLFGKTAHKNYFDSYKKLDSGQSAFVVYMHIKKNKSYAHHYQIIEKEIFAGAISSSVFVSFSDEEDMAFGEYYSVTASLHTACLFWDGLARGEYEKKKEALKERVTALICDKLCLKKEDIKESFAATPKSFERYIGRTSLGGVIMTPKNQFFGVASNDTPFEGLYAVGDTVFAAQGWNGVVMGVRNLECTM
jgi:phytoene dehydrogenase-like protein